MTETTFPFKLKQHFPRRDDWNHGALEIEITDAFHFRNTIHFAQDVGKLPGFYYALGRVLSLASADALPYPADSGPGSKAKLKLMPDSIDEPSFAWAIYREGQFVMNGGLIWHHRSGEWSIHT